MIHEVRRQNRTIQPAGALFAWVVFTAFALAALPARANLGDGFKVGPGRIKLGLELNGRYDSMAAAGLVSSDGTNVSSPGDGIGLMRGTFQLDVPSGSLKFSLGGGLDWHNYLSLNANMGAFSYLGANLNGTLAYNANNAWGVDVTESLSRSDRTNNPLFSVGVLGMQNNTRVRGWMRPGGGAIEVGGYYDLGLDVYSPQVSESEGAKYESCPASDSSCNPLLAGAYNGLLNRFGVDAKWRFLPKTGVTLEANYGYKSYLFGTSVGGPQSAQPIRVVAGFGTLLSTRYTFSLRLGYGGILFDGTTATRNNVLGQAEFGYRISETLTARAGYIRNDEPVAGVNGYFSNNRLYVDARGQFNRLVLSGLMSVDLIAYGASARQDSNLSLGLTGDYNILDWLRITSRASLSTRGVSGIETTAFSDYTRWEAGLGVAALF